MRSIPVYCAIALSLVVCFTIEAVWAQPTLNHSIGRTSMAPSNTQPSEGSRRYRDSITIFMCGDVMTGRGIDQILPHSVDPILYESYMKSSRGYVRLAEKVSGLIYHPVGFAYIWGDALDELKRADPDVRLINLETSVTQSSDYWRGKGINYRMHPGNIPVLSVARIDVCSLANNHVIDWGYPGLLETLAVLKQADLKTVGAGRHLGEARAPAVVTIPGKGRVIVYAFGLPSSGIPPDWGATNTTAGVNLLRSVTNGDLSDFRRNVRESTGEGDVVVASIHWGSNWGYRIPAEMTEFAHRLIDEYGVDIVHGHSSHHVRAVEVYRQKLILYGCGDFINDYEGIRGHEKYRGDLALMYFAEVDPSTGSLLRLQMTPTKTRRFQIKRASPRDTRWLQETLNREGAVFGTRVVMDAEGRLTLVWNNS